MDRYNEFERQASILNEDDKSIKDPKNNYEYIYNID
jgi:hypothetical protein